MGFQQGKSRQENFRQFSTRQFQAKKLWQARQGRAIIPGKANAGNASLGIFREGITGNEIKNNSSNEIPELASPHYSKKCHFVNKFPGKAIICKVFCGISVQLLARQLHARQFQVISSNPNPGHAFWKKGRQARQFQVSQFQGRQFHERQFQFIVEN